MGDGGAKEEARRARQTEEQREARIQGGTRDIRSRFARAFGDKYYAGLEKSAKDYYNPQVQDQFGESMKQLSHALLRRGIYDSSAAATATADAYKKLDLAREGIAEKAKGLANERRQQVAQAENTAVGQLQASGDMTAAAAQAANQIDINSRPQAYQPLGQVFTDFTAGLATQADLERGGTARFNTGLFPARPATSRGYTNVRGP